MRPGAEFMTDQKQSFRPVTLGGLAREGRLLCFIRVSRKGAGWCGHPVPPPAALPGLVHPQRLTVDVLAVETAFQSGARKLNVTTRAGMRRVSASRWSAARGVSWGAAHIPRGCV